MKHSPAILIADNQYLITEALRRILSGEGSFIPAGVVSSGEDLEDFLRDHGADLVILDPSILGKKGIPFLADLKAAHPEIALVILSNHLDINDITSLHKAGIRNILYKTAGNHEIFEALHAALNGDKYYSPEIVDLLLKMHERKKAAAEYGELTPAEKDIVVSIARGWTTKEIAREKNISFHTVMTHRKNIFRKLGINNVSELMMVAMKKGLIDPIDYYI